MRLSLIIVTLVLVILAICTHPVKSQYEELIWESPSLPDITSLRERRGSNNFNRPRGDIEETNSAESARKPDLGGRSTTSTTTSSSRKPGHRRRVTTPPIEPSPSELLSTEESQYKGSTTQNPQNRYERGRRKYATNLPTTSEVNSSDDVRENQTERTPDHTTITRQRTSTAVRRVSKRVDEIDVNEDDNYPEEFKQQIRNRKPALNITATVTPEYSAKSKNVSTSDSTKSLDTSTPKYKDGGRQSYQDGGRQSHRRTTPEPKITTLKGTVNSRNAIFRQSNRGRNNSPKSIEEPVTEVTQVTSITTGGSSRARYSAKHRRLDVPSEQKDNNVTVRSKHRFSAKFNNDNITNISTDSSVASTAPNAVTEPSTKDVTRRDKYSNSASLRLRSSRTSVTPSPVIHISSTKKSTEFNSTEYSTTIIEPNSTDTSHKNNLLYKTPPKRIKLITTNESIEIVTPETPKYDANTINKSIHNKRTPVTSASLLDINTILKDEKTIENPAINHISDFTLNLTTNSKPQEIKIETNDNKIKSDINHGTLIINEILPVTTELPIKLLTTQKTNTIDINSNQGTILINEILQIPTTEKSTTFAKQVNERKENNTRSLSSKIEENSATNEVIQIPKSFPSTSLPGGGVTESSKTTTVLYTGSYSKYTTNRDVPKVEETTTVSSLSSTSDSTSETQEITTQKCLDGTMSRTLCLVNATHLKVFKTLVQEDSQQSSTNDAVTKSINTYTTSTSDVTVSPIIVTPVAFVSEHPDKSVDTSTENIFNAFLQNQDRLQSSTTSNLLALHFPELNDDDKKTENNEATTTSRSTYIYRVPPNKQGTSARGRTRSRGVKYNSVTTDTPTTTSFTSTTTWKPLVEITTERFVSSTEFSNFNSAAELAAQFARETQSPRPFRTDYKNIRNPVYRTTRAPTTATSHAPTPTTSHAPTTTTTQQISSSSILEEVTSPKYDQRDNHSNKNLGGLTEQDLLILDLLSQKRPVVTSSQEQTTLTPINDANDGGLLLSSLLAETQKAKSFHRAVTTERHPVVTTQVYRVVQQEPVGTGGSGSNLFSYLRQISGGSSGFQQPPTVTVQLGKDEVYLEPSTTAPVQEHRNTKRQRYNFRSRTTTIPPSPPEDIYIIKEEEPEDSQGNLVSMAINVTKSVAGVMGRFLQGAARTVTAVVSTSGRAFADYLQSWQNPAQHRQ